MALGQSTRDSDPHTTNLRTLLTPPDDWGVMTQRQQEAATLRSILDDFIRDGGWQSQPQMRRAAHAWSAVAGRTGDPRDEW